MQKMEFQSTDVVKTNNAGVGSGVPFSTPKEVKWRRLQIHAVIFSAKVLKTLVFRKTTVFSLVASYPYDLVGERTQKVT